jgi:hypothetical protein
MDDETEHVAHRIEVSGQLDRRAAEALLLEARRLARRYGLEIGEIRVETAEPEPEH